MARTWARKCLTEGGYFWNRGRGINTVCPLAQETIGPSIMQKSWTFPYVEYMHRSFLANWLANYYTLYYSLDS